MELSGSGFAGGLGGGHSVRGARVLSAALTFEVSNFAHSVARSRDVGSVALLGRGQYDVALVLHGLVGDGGLFVFDSDPETVRDLLAYRSQHGGRILPKGDDGVSALPANVDSFGFAESADPGRSAVMRGGRPVLAAHAKLERIARSYRSRPAVTIDVPSWTGVHEGVATQSGGGTFEGLSRVGARLGWQNLSVSEYSVRVPPGDPMRRQLVQLAHMFPEGEALIAGSAVQLHSILQGPQTRARFESSAPLSFTRARVQIS